jgi:hypothetical protein
MFLSFVFFCGYACKGRVIVYEIQIKWGNFFIFIERKWGLTCFLVVGEFAATRMRKNQKGGNRWTGRGLLHDVEKILIFVVENG